MIAVINPIILKIVTTKYIPILSPVLGFFDDFSIVRFILTVPSLYTKVTS